MYYYVVFGGKTMRAEEPIDWCDKLTKQTRSMTLYIGQFFQLGKCVYHFSVKAKDYLVTIDGFRAC